MHIRKKGTRVGKNNNSGDTIVEVLLSITIIAFVLGAAYLLTSRSLQAGIAAREHTEALNYVQGQIERLKSAKENIPPDDFKTTYEDSTPTSQPFCLFVDTANGNALSKEIPAANNPDKCAVDSDHPNGGGRYHLTVTYKGNTGNNPNTFKFSATWERTGTGTPEEADIYYRTIQ